MLKFPDIVVKSSPDMRLFKRPENGVWYAEIYRNIKRSLHTKDEQEAKVRFKELQKRILKDKISFLEKGTSISLSDFFTEYILYLRKKNYAYSTYERVERIAEKFIKVFGRSRYIRSLTKKDMDTYVEYCREKKNSPVTINTEIRHIKAALGYAVDPAGYLKVNPFAGYKQLKYHKKRAAFIEEPESINRVFETIDQTPNPRSRKIYRLVFALYVYTGARRSEIWKLEWKDIKKDIIVFRERKNYEMLEVPMAGRLKEILLEYERGVGRVIPLTLDQIGRGIKYYLRKAGLGHLRPHDLRHTFASHLLMSGVDIETVRRLLGQTSLVATRTYSHILERHKKEEIRKLPY